MKLIEVLKANPQKPLKFNEKHITMVVTYHCLADIIEGYATDYKMDELVELTAKIRFEANMYGERFIKLSDYMKDRIEALKYNHRQLLPVLCFVLYSEAVKIRTAFIRENPKTDFTLMEASTIIRDYFKGEFMSREMLKAISDIIIDIRKNNFVY